MSINFGVVGYYIYSLVVIGVFLAHWRNWAFIRVTFLYFVIFTAFVCLLLYGSAYSLESNLSQWQQGGMLTTFPFTITGAGPDAHTIAKTSTSYWLLTSMLIAFFATFPQAVLRGARLHLRDEESPTTIMKKLTDNYKKMQPVLAFIKKAWPHVWPHISGNLGNAYSIGEWIFVLIALTSLASPFPTQNLPLMLLGCFFVVLLAGSDIVTGTGLVSIVLKLLIPGMISAMQRFVAFTMKVILFLFSLLIALFAGSLLLSLAYQIFHTQNLNFVIIIVIVLLSIGVLWASFALFAKVILFPIVKLIEWMEIEIIDPAKSRS